MRYLSQPNLHSKIAGYVTCTKQVYFPRRSISTPFLLIRVGHVLPFFCIDDRYKVKTIEGVLELTPYEFYQKFEVIKKPVPKKMVPSNVSLQK